MSTTTTTGRKATRKATAPRKATGTARPETRKATAPRKSRAMISREILAAGYEIRAHMDLPGGDTLTVFSIGGADVEIRETPARGATAVRLNLAPSGLRTHRDTLARWDGRTDTRAAAAAKIIATAERLGLRTGTAPRSGRPMRSGRRRY